MRIAYDWNDKAKGFDRTAPCLCFAYKGQPTCPHEYVKERPTCVHCGHMVATEKKAT